MHYTTISVPLTSTDLTQLLLDHHICKLAVQSHFGFDLLQFAPVREHSVLLWRKLIQILSAPVHISAVVFWLQATRVVMEIAGLW